MLIALTGSGVGDADVVEIHQPLWLWPLPPPETFTLTTSWPAYGIATAGHDLDGAAIAAASAAARGYWD